MAVVLAVYSVDWVGINNAPPLRRVLLKSDVVLGQTSQSVSYRPRYDACRNIGVGLKMVTTLTLVVYTCIMGIEPPTKS